MWLSQLLISVLKKKTFIWNYQQWHLFRWCKDTKYFFFIKYAPKNAPIPQMARIGPVKQIYMDESISEYINRNPETHIYWMLKVIMADWYCVFWARYSEAVIQRYSIKKVFLEISQNSQGNTSARVSLSCRPQPTKHPFLWNTCGSCFCVT